MVEIENTRRFSCRWKFSESCLSQGMMDISFSSAATEILSEIGESFSLSGVPVHLGHCPGGAFCVPSHWRSLGSPFPGWCPTLFCYTFSPRQCLHSTKIASKILGAIEYGYLKTSLCSICRSIMLLSHHGIVYSSRNTIRNQKVKSRRHLSIYRYRVHPVYIHSCPKISYHGRFAFTAARPSPTPSDSPPATPSRAHEHAFARA